MVTVENDNRDNQGPDSPCQNTASANNDTDAANNLTSTSAADQACCAEDLQANSSEFATGDDRCSEMSHEQPQMPPPPWEPPQGLGTLEPPEPPKRKTNLFISILLCVLGFAVIASAIAGWKLYSDRTKMAAALNASLESMQTAALGVDNQKQVAEAIQALETGDYARVQAIMGNLTSSATYSTTPKLLPSGTGQLDPAEALNVRPSRGEALPPEAYNDLPQGAVKYFKSHEDILRAFLEQCAVSRSLRDQGVDVDDLRKVRDAIIEAANIGQHDRVQALLVDMTKMTIQKGAPAPEMPEELIAQVQRFRTVAQEAQRQRRDIRPAIKMMQQADKLALEGKTDEAVKLVQKAIDSAENAKRMQLRRPAVLPTGMNRRLPVRGAGAEVRRPAERGNVAQVLLQSLLAMISAEEMDLSRAYHAIDNAKVAMREKNGEQVKQILNTALESFEVIGKRRQDFSKTMNKMMSRAAQSEVPLQGNRPRPDSAAHQEQMRPTSNADRMQRLIRVQADRAMQVLERAHNLSDEEFARRREAIKRELIFALTPPDQMTPKDTGTPETAKKQPEMRPTDQINNLPTYETATERAKAEERIRSKMRQVQEPYNKLKKSGDAPELVAELEKIFSAARLSLYAEELVEAEVLVDEGMRALGMEVIPMFDDAQIEQILDTLDLPQSSDT